ncbi:SLOG family protein [Streptomyces syringium]|uniref:SLOG family protein n=1 Tax=Streptomyces syringium TaxID=76729 RepID=UPI00341B4A78
MTRLPPPAPMGPQTPLRAPQGAERAREAARGAEAITGRQAGTQGPARILVTGSRNWPDERLVRLELSRAWYQLSRAWYQHGHHITVVHGNCPTGADHHAALWADNWAATGLGGVTEELHPADWATHGRAAGPIRNRHMVDLGADLCLAFIKDRSAGATHCAGLAETAGIPTRRWTA